jgi:hypothetical protein
LPFFLATHCQSMHENCKYRLCLMRYLASMEADRMLVKAETGARMEAGLCQLSEAATDLLLRPGACCQVERRCCRGIS